MSDRTKKIIFAVVFVCLSIAIGFGLYYFFFRPLISPPGAAPTPGITGGLPSAGPGVPQPGVAVTPPGVLPSGAPVQIQPGAPTQVTPPSNVTLLSDTVTQAVSPSKDGQGARFYNPEDGRFYRVNADGTVSLLGDKQFFNVSTVSWGNKDDQAILKFPDGSNVFYDFAAKRQVTLPTHWQDFNFSPDDTKFAAESIGLDVTNRFLIVSSPDGGEAKAIEPLGQNADKTIVSWAPNNQVIAFAQTGRPQPDGGEEIYLLGQNHENFKSLIVPGRGFLPNWSPSGNHILYSVYHERDDLKPSLWVSGGSGDNIGENRRGLNLNTWADKCTWKNEFSLICGVPQNLDTGAGLARQNFTGVPDDIYQVNLTTGVSSKISAPDQIHPIKNPVLSADKKKLVFSDAVTGRLYSYDLP